jgi:hypothetical protein
MNETTLALVNSSKIICIALFSLLYGLGGVSGKWKRRVIGPVVYTAGIAGFSLWIASFTFWYLLCAPLLYVALSIGYGGNDIKTKLIKRSRYGLACATASLPIFVVSQAWTLLLLHALICVSVSTLAGTWNQTSSARAEETLIGASIVLVPLFVI